jgi:fucose permease
MPALGKTGAYPIETRRYRADGAGASLGNVTTALADDYRLLHAAAYMAMFCVGLYAAAFGPSLPFIADDLGVSLDTAGLILTALFIGSISASALVAVKLHGFDTRALCVAGLACATAGLLLIAFAPTWPAALAGCVLLGTGDGLMVAATHIMMPLTSDDAASGINHINLAFAFGATCGPIWAGAVLATSGARWMVFAGIACVTLAALLLAAVADARVHHPIAAPDEEFRLPGNPTAWIMGGVLFLYVGAEFGLGSWVSSYTRETAHASVFVSALLASGYWAALALGRIVSGVYFSRRGEASTLLIVAVAGGGIAALVLSLSSGHIAIAGAAAFCAGLCFGPIWPATIAIVSEAAASDATAATVTMGNAGGLAIPWLQGKVLVGAGPSQGVAVTAVLCGLMFAAIAAFRAGRSGEARDP